MEEEVEGVMLLVSGMFLTTSFERVFKSVSLSSAEFKGKFKNFNKKLLQLLLTYIYVVIYHIYYVKT